MQAVQDDGVVVFVEGETSGSAKPNFAMQAMYIAQTVYSQNYSLLVVDEAHHARKHNKLHMALRALRQQAQSVLTLTATPVTTKPHVSLHCESLRSMSH